MVGPNYEPPVTWMPDDFSENQSDETSVIADEELAHWWTFFDEPAMNDLLAESLQGNFDLQIAVEKVCQARSAWWVQATAILPEVDSDAQAIRSRTSESLITTNILNVPPIQSFYQVGFDAIWEIDIFGGLRRAARAAHRLWESSAEDARYARIVILSEVAMTYANICAFQQAVGVAEQTVVLDEGLLSLAETRFDAGLTNEQEVEAAVATLAIDRANLLVLEINLKQAIYSLSVLVGRPPETFVEQFSISRPIPYAVGKIPLGLPADLLRRRPDIRSAERQLASATEQIGVAVADLFPKFNLTGSSASFSSNPLQGANFGWASNALRQLFKAPSRIWGFGGLITWPLFDFGKRLAMIDEQVSLERQALYYYEKTVISALQEVESDLVAYFSEEERVINFTTESDAYQRTLELTVDLFEAGLANYTQVLQARETWLTAVTSLISSQQALTTDLIALYKALGGGWECSYTP